MKYSQKDALTTWDQEDVDNYLKQEGFDQGELDYVRSIDDLEDRLIKAGESFADIGWHNFAQTQLAMLMFDWEEFKRRNIITPVTNKLYKAKKQMLNKTMNLNTNCMQLLREDTDNYSGNLYEARKYWKKFIPQKNDWKDNIKLPLEIDRPLAMLLGIILCKGQMEVVHHASNPSKLRIQGRSNETELFEQFILPEAVKHFNKVVYINKFRKMFGEKLRFPILDIFSTAVCTWLEYDLGFNLVDHHRSLPSIDFTDEEIRKGFLEGIMAKKSVFVPGGLLFRTKNKELDNSIQEVLKLNNVHFTESYSSVNDNYSINIPKSELKRLSRHYLFINPKHLIKINDFIDSVNNEMSLEELLNIINTDTKRGYLTVRNNRLKLIRYFVEKFVDNNKLFPVSSDLRSFSKSLLSYYNSNSRALYYDAGYLDENSPLYSEKLDKTPWLVQKYAPKYFWCHADNRKRHAEWLADKLGTSLPLCFKDYESNGFFRLYERHRDELKKEGLLT